ncbi:hypothetical protein C8F04DRAFT_1187719 [Mycena alexandri]|uniref:Uncharacterized protein n=1 Tax=Mycena alexandri TaxID=1745969 RepID=A0AAD6SK83_9AGAR|nr:hypothetical protein C8F04DRAFT_1187719 [Mycena alexandri]
MRRQLGIPFPLMPPILPPRIPPGSVPPYLVPALDSPLEPHIEFDFFARFREETTLRDPEQPFPEDPLPGEPGFKDEEDFGGELRRLGGGVESQKIPRIPIRPVCLFGKRLR